jgi:SagB-type dehydrogenase family enzyme
MTWREYHEATKHSAESLRRSQHFLDWANMPDPFRHYEGVPVLDLPADPPPLETSTLEVLRGASGRTTATDGPTFLSQLLFHAAAISASKRVLSTGYRYALRVNPSSGNLHPTEFHFFTRGLKDWPDGLYHYRPSSHMAEQRALGNFKTMPAGSSASIVFVLTSIAWREAWKYQDRAYRYCLHDMGHAWQSLTLAARAMGCDSFATGRFADESVARVCRLNEDEWPMLIIELSGASIPLRDPDAGEPVWFDGQANRLSDNQIAYRLIDEMHAATTLGECESQGVPIVEAAPAGCGEIRLPAPASPVRPFGEIVRTRRSALDFEGGNRRMSLAQLSALLAVTAQPFESDFGGARFVQLYLYAHRVDGLEPGVYRYWPGRGELEQIRSGDQRVAAAGLSLGQDLAGNACVAFSMIADLDRATRAYGDRGYRYAHFEAGAIGHRLYLAAEALRLRATGIGAFFDDQVHRYLNVHSDQGQVIYHFAVGFPVTDLRLEA